jgi:hypothetical protein
MKHLIDPPTDIDEFNTRAIAKIPVMTNKEILRGYTTNMRNSR